MLGYAIAALVAVAETPAHAQSVEATQARQSWSDMLATPGLTLGTGIDYTSGGYGTGQSTEILYLPFFARYETGRWLFRLTVPYIRITGPGNVRGAGDDRVTLPRRGGPSRTESGLGDIVASGFYNVVSERSAPIGVDLGVKVKFATADETKGLGTGQNDYSLQADFFKAMGKSALFGSLGHRWYGDPPGIDLKDVFYGSIGASHRFSTETSGGLVYDYRPAIVAGGGEVSELTAFLSQRMGGEWKLQPYALLGFGRASPDYGVGVQVTHSY
ncbi:MAG: transporter [Burkholderiales bacterium]